jgi:hypothetical protein
MFSVTKVSEEGKGYDVRNSSLYHLCSYLHVHIIGPAFCEMKSWDNIVGKSRDVWFS